MTDRLEQAFSLLGQGYFEETLPTAHPLGPKGSRARSRRLAAGTPSILTAWEIHKGINFRKTFFALGPSL